MIQLSQFSRAAVCTTFVLALASACGGQSFTSMPGGDAGSSQGGTTGDAGSTSQAGKGHAGSGHAGSGTGGSISTAGTTSTGGSSPYNEACDAPPVSGNCDAYVPSWYHEPATGLCRPFVYGGCGGNANRYASLEECNKACPGGTTNYDSCKTASDCTISGTGCCGVCDSPSLSTHDFIAYNRIYGGVLQCGAALDIAPPPGSPGAGAPIACAPCPGVPVGTGTLQYFVPDCVQNQCVVEDLRTGAATACKTAMDCKLRHGAACCESCGSGDLISVRNDGSFEKLVCSASPEACDACAPLPNPDAVAVCNEGRCGVAYFEAGGAPQ